MSERATHVLLIEGDADQSAVLKRSLLEGRDGGRSFSVMEAARLSTACRLLARDRFDAVLIDLSLSQSVGIEGLRKLRSQTPETPILVLTGLQDEAVAVEAVREGAQDYLVKGTLDCCLLSRAILHAIERKRLSLEIERLLSLRDASDPARLRRLEAEALESLRVVEIKNQFMGRISHELRNALATVKTAVFCLNDGFSGPLNARQSRLVEMISRNVDRQVRLIDNILDLARFQSGKIKIVPRRVEIPQVLDEIVQEFRIKNKTQRLVIETSGDLPAVNGDADLLVQVLRNLLDNAFRYARSRVTVMAAVHGSGEVLLSVVDDGEGIPQERIGDLFSQFVQFDRPRGGNGYKGTGLGLAICKEIIEGHRGRIWAESREGDGARFHVLLPSCGEAEPAPARAAADGPVETSRRVQE